MTFSQPKFKVCERTIPTEYLNDEGEGEAGNMNNFCERISYSETSAKNQKEYPEEMHEDRNIGKNSIHNPVYVI